MRIALDFDGVIHDVTGVKQRYARDIHRLDLGRADVWRPLVLNHLTEEEHVELVRVTHTTRLLGPAEAMLGALEAIEALAAEHELYVVTARNDDEIPFAREWLEALGLPVREVWHTRRESKVETCRALGISLLLDDSPYVIRQLCEGGVPAALLSTPYNEVDDLPPEVHLVADWEAFIALCKNVPLLAPASA